MSRRSLKPTDSANNQEFKIALLRKQHSYQELLRYPKTTLAPPRAPSKTTLRSLTNDLTYAEEVDMKDALGTLGIDHRLVP